MKALAAYVMRGRAEAILVVTVMAVLSLLIPPVILLSGAALGLVSLRLGPRHASEVMLGSTVALTVIGLVLAADPGMGGMVLLPLWLPVWVLAGNLRRRGKLAATILMVGLFGVMVVVGFFVGVDDPTAWWRDVLRESELDPELIELVSSVATGGLAILVLMPVVGSLFLARGWQAMLFNPGGLAEEFRQLRLGRVAALAMLSCLVLSIIGVPGLELLVANLLPVGTLIFVIQALAIAHWLLWHFQAPIQSVVLLYGALLVSFVLAPALISVLMLAGVIDNWFDFRAFMANRAQK